MKKIAGIDEAGRGPVIGPMIIAGVLVSEDKINELLEIGVKDSKLLTPKIRGKLAPLIKNIVDDYVILEIKPSEIDTYVENNKLNVLEAEKFAFIIKKLKPDIVYTDAPQRNVKKYSLLIQRMLDYSPKIISENYAERYPVVAAASILAKVKRDNIIDHLKLTYGELGSGYCHDPATKNFLIKWYREHKYFPNIVRKSWSTIREIENKYSKRQKKLIEFK